MPDQKLEQHNQYKRIDPMPIFEYQCTQCKKEFEKLVFSGEDKNISCPECKSKDARKKMSVSSFMENNSLGKCATSSPKDFS